MLLDFPYKTRTEALQSVPRFNELTMFYRQDLNMHRFSCKAVAKQLFQDLIPQGYFPGVDLKLVLDMLDVHDDPEIVDSDISTHRKAKLTGYEKQVHELRNLAAKSELVRQFAHEVSFDYLRYMEMYEKKDCMESQLCSMIDKFVGFGFETIHECLHGNYALMDDGVNGRYINLLYGLKNKYGNLNEFLTSKNKLNFTSLEYLTLVSAQLTNLRLVDKPFEILEIPKNTGIRIYDYCVSAILNEDNDFATEILTIERKSGPIVNSQ